MRGPRLFNQRVSSPQNPLSNVVDAACMPTASPPIQQDGRELGDGLGIFLQRIARTRLLTPAEELELARRISRFAALW